MFRRILMLLLVTVMLLSGAVAVSAASADPVFGITCGAGPAGAGSMTTEFSPGIHAFEPRVVTSQTRKDFTNCGTLSDLTLHSGRTDYTIFLGSITCINLLTPIPYEFTIYWDNATDSHTTVQVTQILITNQVLVEGIVTDGLFEGMQYREWLTVLSLSTPLDCLSSTGAVRATGTELLLDISPV